MRLKRILATAQQRLNKYSLCRLLAMLVCSVIITEAILPILPVYAADEDIARGKTAIACHTQTAILSPDKAVDGNSSSRFAAGTGCTHNTWYILDLGDNYDLSSVRINWQKARPSSYVLEISKDGEIYTELKQVNKVSTGWNETSVQGMGRFFRIRELARTQSDTGFSMWDLEVYGTLSSERNDTPYHKLSVEKATNGTLKLSHEGLVSEKTQVTLTVTPSSGCSLTQLLCNEKDVTDQVIDGKYVFYPNEEMTFSAKFSTAPASHFECEDAIVLDSDGVTEIRGIRRNDPDASNLAIAGLTGGKYFVFENVTEANCIHIAYATTNTNSMNLFIRYPWEEDFHDAGQIPFSTSNSWEMKSSYIAVSPLIYIPAGSDIKIRPNVDCNLDCLWLTSETAATPSDAPLNTVTAAMISDKAEKDVMATYAKCIKLEKGQSVTFKAPDADKDYNVLSLSYRAEATAKISLKKGTAYLGNMELGTTALRAYERFGMCTQPYSSGDELTLTVTDGEIWLDYVTSNYAVTPEAVTVTDLPDAGERLTVSLDGMWSIGKSDIPGVWNVPATIPDEVAFINTIPVPGLWHSAAYDLGDYRNAMAWYRRSVVLENEPEGQVLLYIGSAQYGRHIYVNGQYVDSYEYNYSHSYTDISKYLKKGENEIVIMLGAWSQQFNDPKSVAHVLYDGESTEDEPGITDTVSLIFNAPPEVQSVQTNPNINKGTVQVQVTLNNRSEKVVTSDVTISVYELGIFKNGVASQAEVKVGEYIQKDVEVNAKGSTSFTVDAVALEQWSKDKCWAPDSPFLYRIEIKTAGDTYSVRFGMRTFDFDPVTHYARLNGEIFYLFGTNVAIERYYDDPLCGNTPWEEDWIRKLYSEYKDVNWSCFRTHLGHANSKWFDLADEMGLMIFDEYASWGDYDGCTVDTIMPEIYAWIDSRANHPSVIVFDAVNEAKENVICDEIIRRGREYDLQKRPWDNGWRAPIGENDPVECHPYIIGSEGISGLNNMNVSKPIVTTANIGWDYHTHPNHPYFINEHGEYWINREGAALSGTENRWNSALPGATNEERLVYYAELMAAQMEAFRTKRAYVGLLFFCGLGSSFPSAQGMTSDILAPDVSTAETLQIRPYTKKLFKSAFADLGIVIDEYAEEVQRGQKFKLPIVLINDTGEAVTDLPVTFKIMSGNTVLYAEKINMSVEAFSKDNKGLATASLLLAVPAFREYCEDGTTLMVTASYTLDDVTVSSQRKWKIAGGTALNDDELPVYDWLVNEEETEPSTETEVSTDPVESDPLGSESVESEPLESNSVENKPSESDSIGTNGNATPDQNGCSSVISATVLMAAVAGTVLLLQKRKKKGEE